MPKKYYAIGVGGTGAKILEAMIRLCECGYISVDVLNVVMVDVDKENGNSMRTDELIKKYTEVRKLLDSKTIFHTEITGGRGGNYKIQPITAKTKGISIERDLVKNATGSDSVSAYNVMKAFLKEDEYTQVVDEGFYQNPLLGSIFLDIALEGSSNLLTLLEDIAKETENGTDVMVFIAGSAFGGTGSSGILPISAKLVEKMENRNRDKLHIFGCLMLPYFKYDPETAPTDEKNLYEKYKTTTRSIIEEYKTLAESDETEDKFFDKLYMAGDPSLPIRGVFSKEGTRQHNWPHIYELFAAAEGKNFYESPTDYVNEPPYRHLNENVYSNPHIVVKLGDPRETIENLAWEHFTGSEVLRTSIEKFFLFNYYFSTIVTALLCDHLGEIENYFGAWEIDNIPNSQSSKRRDKIPDEWIDVFVKQANRTIISRLFGDGGNHREWLPVDRKAIAKLFQYLSNSAKWYYKVVHKYPNHDGVKPCWDGSGGCVNCIDNRAVLLTLFGTQGCKMLAERACIPKRDLYDLWIGTENFRTRIGTDSLSTKRELPKLEDIVIKKGASNERIYFQNLVAKLYENIGNKYDKGEKP